MIYSIKRVVNFWKLLLSVLRKWKCVTLISSLCSVPLRCTKQAEWPEYMAGCAELMHQRLPSKCKMQPLCPRGNAELSAAQNTEDRCIYIYISLLVHNSFHQLNSVHRLGLILYQWALQGAKKPHSFSSSKSNWWRNERWNNFQSSSQHQHPMLLTKTSHQKHILKIYIYNYWAWNVTKWKGVHSHPHIPAL